MAKKKKLKAIVLTPKMPKRREKDMAKKSDVKTKRSVVVHKKDEKIDSLYQLLGQLESNIEELTRMYTEAPESKHYGVGGKMKPTHKQEILAEQIKRAQRRADRLMKMIENK